jgi:hypothetical protein
MDGVQKLMHSGGAGWIFFQPLCLQLYVRTRTFNRLSARYGHVFFVKLLCNIHIAVNLNLHKQLIAAKNQNDKYLCRVTSEQLSKTKKF